MPMIRKRKERDANLLESTAGTSDSDDTGLDGDVNTSAVQPFT